MARKYFQIKFDENGDPVRVPTDDEGQVQHARSGITKTPLSIRKKKRREKAKKKRKARSK